MAEHVKAENPKLDHILRDLVTKREFSELAYEDALLFFCKVLSETLNAPRVGIWEFTENNDALRAIKLWDRQSGIADLGVVLTTIDASTYLQAVSSELVVIVNDALTDPRCVELALEYLPSTNVSALLDCPVRTFSGLAGVVCIEETGQPRNWTSDEVHFAAAIAGLVALTIEHHERNIAEKAAQDQETRLKTYTDLATDWLWETDEDFRFQILHGNQADDGQMPANYVGKKIWDVPILSPLDGNWDWLKSKIKDRKRLRDIVVSATDAAGDTYYAELAGLPKFETDGTYLGYWGTAKDVTRRVRQDLRLAESEQRYKSAARIARLGNWVWDEITDSCVYCSPELAEIYGYSVEEFLNRTKTAEAELEWCYPEDRDHYQSVIAEAQKNQTGYEITSRIVRGDGSIRTLQESTEAVFDENGRFIATAGVLRDITEHVDMRKKLQTNEDRLKGIVANIPGAIYRVKYDANFTGVYRSEGYLKQFVDPSLPLTSSASNQDLPSPNIRDSDRQRIDSLLQQAVALNQAYEVEYSITLKDGTEKRISDRGRPVITAAGNVELEGIMIDVTEKHAAQTALAHGQRLEAIGKLTGGMAHDFNNLLAVVLGNLELLRDELSDVDQLDWIESGIGAVHRGAELTKNMLAFARQSELNLERLDLSLLASKAKKWIGRTLPGNIDIKTTLLVDLWQIEADASSTESAILNLIINAKDAMPGGGTLTLETSNVQIADHLNIGPASIAPGPYVLLCVSDTGCGIPDEVLANIFEPFFTTKPPGSGSGLGLSMILGFMEQSGGGVRVETQPGVGTKFELYFKALARKVENNDQVPESQLPRTPGKPRLLVVDDDQGILAVLKAYLTRSGYDFQIATTGDEAQRIFESDPQFDLMLTDMNMPGTLQGSALAKVLRQRKPELRVVFMSGADPETTGQESEFDPQDIHLMKPVQRVDLINAIETALSHVG